MSLMDSIFGGSMGHSIGNTLGGSISGALGGIQNPPQYSNAWYNQQGLANAYSAAQQQAFRPARWVVDGVQYHSLTEFAEAVFGDTPAKTMYILKNSDKGDNK